MAAVEGVGRTTLLVIYTKRLNECRDFYSKLGLVFVRERHDTGPEHFAATLPGGMVIELYPATTARITHALRLGLEVDGKKVQPALSPGLYRRTDPDGRVVEIHAR
jgi:catechol 2,3-dioxygenase-like lactoylglutathione lyase family enzyme